MKKEVLNLLHERHFGIKTTLATVNKLYYWPKMYTCITEIITKCKVCEKYRPTCTKEPMMCHEIAYVPFQKVANDILQYKNKDYLVISDYYSKWIEVIPLKNKTSTEIINKLKRNLKHTVFPRIDCR